MSERFTITKPAMRVGKSQSVTTADVCERSFRLFQAEASVPFASRGAAAKENLNRIEKIKKVVYHIASIGMFGGTESPHNSVEEIDRYHAEAERLGASRNRCRPCRA